MIEPYPSSVEAKAGPASTLPDCSPWPEGCQWPEAALIPLALCGLAVALAAGSLLLLLVPQRLAQRPLRQGIVVVRVDPAGRLRLWNQPITAAELRPLLQRAARQPRRPRLRLQPDPRVSWGQAQALVAELEQLPLPLELQLPGDSRASGLNACACS